eukprot:6044260-Prymnesium_polylepis.1
MHGQDSSAGGWRTDDQQKSSDGQDSVVWLRVASAGLRRVSSVGQKQRLGRERCGRWAVSYTHLRAHETLMNL